MEEKNETFIYCPWDLSWDDYWAIAKDRVERGQYLPVYYYTYAAKFAGKIYNILTQRKDWERCYKTRYMRLAFKFHKWTYNHPPMWWFNKSNKKIT